MNTREGSSFAYWPDGMEYAAGAQSIADSGEYYLQVGPHRVRPRYSPGFSMFLAPLLWLGVDATDFWRVPAVIAGLHAVLLAVSVMLLIPFLSGRARDRGGWVPGVAGLLGGVVWCLAPISVDVGRVPMSDEVAGFFANLALFLAVLGLLACAHARMALPLWLAGVALGVSASIRSIEGILLVPVIAFFFLAALSLRGRAVCTRRALWFFMGYLLPTGLTWYLLQRSGFNPWTWSAYEYWAPEWYTDLSTTFSLKSALHGSASRPLLALGTGEELGFYWIPAQIFLGIKTTAYYGFGQAWSWLGVPALLFLTFRMFTRSRSGRWARMAVVVGITGWILGHVVVFSTYFFHSERFYLAAAAVWSFILCAGMGLSYLSLRGVFRYLPPLVLLLFLYGEWRGVQRIWSEPWQGVSPAVHEVQFRIDPWLDLPDEVRSRFPIPFDTVLAQALGYLPKSVSVGIAEWGILTGTYYHDYMVATRKHLLSSTAEGDAREPKAPILSSFPAGVRTLGARQVRFDPADRSMRFQLLSPDKTELLQYRIPLQVEGGQGGLRIEELHYDHKVVAELTAAGPGSGPIEMQLVHWGQIGESLQIQYLLRSESASLLTVTAVLELYGRSLRVCLVSGLPWKLKRSIALRLETFVSQNPAVHVASHWDGYASQAMSVSADPAETGKVPGVHPIFENGQKLSPGSLGTFYVTVSDDARDLAILQPGPGSPYTSVLLETVLLRSGDSRYLSDLRNELTKVRLPAPLRIAEDSGADIRLQVPSIGGQADARSVGERLRDDVSALRAAGKSGPIAWVLAKDEVIRSGEALDGSVDLIIQGEQALSVRPPVGRKSLWGREVSFAEDALDRARRLQDGVLPVFRIDPSHAASWAELLTRYVYLELPLLRAIHGSHLESEMLVGAEGRRLLKYKNGLQLWLNLSATPWEVANGDESYRLGRGGYLAVGSKGLLAGFIEDTQGQGSRFLKGVDGITASATPGQDVRFSVRDESHRFAYKETASGTSLTELPRRPVDKFVVSAERIPRLGLGQQRLRLCGSRFLGGRSFSCRWDSIAWESLDPKVASVDRFGIVQVRGEGIARIRGSLEDGKGVAEISLPSSARPVLSDIRERMGSQGLALGFRCDRPCVQAGVRIRTPGRDDQHLFATHDPSWMSFQIWIPASSLTETSTLTLLVRDQFGLDGSSKPFSAGR